MVTINFMDNSTQVVRVSADFFKPTQVNKNKILSVKDKVIELAWSFKKKPANVTLSKGATVVLKKEFGIAPPPAAHNVATVKENPEELKHLKKMFKNQVFTTFVKK